MRSIENDRPLLEASKNPFETEISLYTKEKLPSDIPVTVVVPDFYHVALPNIGHQMIEHQINRQEGFFADRAYLSNEYGLLKEVPSEKPEIVFVSMSYEGSYIRSLRSLDLLGIDPERKNRKPSDPLVIAGGWSVSRNPLPLFEIADIIGIGDSEKIVRDVTSSYKTNRDEREKLYDELASKQGMFIPSRYEVATKDGYLSSWKARNAPIDIYPSESQEFPHSWYLSSETDYNDIGYYEGKTFFSMEIVNACASKCAFCASGYRDKVRDVQDIDTVVAMAEWGAENGADLTKLFFPANSSVPATKEMISELTIRGLSPRVGSAKAERIDREYIELVGKSGQEKIAFAPETGDYELRKAIGKAGMTNEVLERVVKTSVQSGIPNLDLYLIMNLPKESPETFQKTIDLLLHLQDVARSEGLQGRVRMSIPNFFPKAGTPFQYARSGELETYSSKVSEIEDALGGKIKVSSMDGDVDLLSQNIMSRGGIEASQLLNSVYSKLKQKEVTSGRFSPDTVQDWRDSMDELKIEENTFFDEKSANKPLPWEHIHSTKMSPDTFKKAWQVFKDRRAVFILE